jgi:sigma-E factor negative regulatory protein RseC
MIEESATIIACEDEFAMVETLPQATCGTCQSKTGCSTSILSPLFKRRHTSLRVRNPIRAQPGQQVIIGIQDHALITYSMIAYLVPLLGLILLAIGLEQLAQYWEWRNTDLAAILGGFAGFLLGLVYLKRFSNHRKQNHAYQPVILRQANPTPIQFN